MVSEAREPANTRIHLLYRDAANYKQWASFVVEGAVSPEELASWRARLEAGARLKVPDLARALGVKLPDPRAEMIDTFGLSPDDHDWVELHDAEPTSDSATVEANAEQLGAAVHSLGNR